LITILIVSESGDDTLELSPEEALAEMKRQVEKNGKWLFVNGVLTDVSKLTVGIQRCESVFMLTNRIRAG